MKKILFALILALPMALFAQKTPKAVENAFKQRFPNISKVSFDHEKNGEYEANFKINGMKTSANFTATGEWRETETEIQVSELPSVVSQGILAKFPKAKIVGAAKIETAQNGIRYEADIKTGLKKTEVLFDATGNFVK
jgi:uncharacterized protein YxeA